MSAVSPVKSKPATEAKEAKQSDSEEPESPMKEHVSCQKHSKDLIQFRDGSIAYCMRRPAWLNTTLLAGVAAAGFAEGYYFNLCGMARDPAVMSSQMKFEINIVLRLFMAAVGGSALAQGIMSFVMHDFFNETRNSRYSKPPMWKVVTGASLVGIGIACGAGATMSPAMLAAGVKSAPATVAGFFVGSALYYYLEKFGVIPHNPEVNEFAEKLVIDEQVGIDYWKLAIPMGAAMLGGAALLEQRVFSVADEQKRLAHIGALAASPVAAGLVIGLNQVILRMVAHHGQGGSSAPATILSALTGRRISPGMWHGWAGSLSQGLLGQVTFVYVGTMLGSWYAMKANPTFRAAEGPSYERAFLGGVCALVGGKLAGGCACGAGVTGSSELNPRGFVAGAVMFGVGILFSSLMGW